MRRLQTDEEWRTWDHPRPLLKLLDGRATDRKARLFDAACWRRLWDAPEVAQAHGAIEILERLADGSATPEEAVAAARTFRDVRFAAACVMGGMYNQPAEDLEVQRPDPWSMAWLRSEAMAILAGRVIRRASGSGDGRPDHEQRAPEERAQCDLIRCIFPSPFQPVASQDGWLTSTVVELARGIYAERAFDRLPILADALQDAGCDNADVLDHCRGPGPHARGCWALDLVLGKS
jgi:hypothetical protein